MNGNCNVGRGLTRFSLSKSGSCRWDQNWAHVVRDAEDGCVNNRQRFKALLFDFDETLVPEHDAAAAAIGEFSVEIRNSHPLDQDLGAMLHTAAARLIDETPVRAAATKAFGPGSLRWAVDELMWDDKYPMTELTALLGDFRRKVWAEAFETAGIVDSQLALDMAERLPSAFHERRVPYPGVENVLTTLGQRHPMAILTNGEPIIQAGKVDRSGLKHHFDHVVLCDEHGSKPDPEPFLVALDLLGCEPRDVAMIGNSLASDIAGARNAGIFSVWVNRSGGYSPPADSAQPDATVRELSELLDLL